jgi:branched-chain amino acid transport system permease protein
MNFAQGDIMTLGAFLGYTFFKLLHIPFIPSVLITVTLMFFFGIFMERAVIRVLQNQGVMMGYLLLATFAISYILQNGAQATWGSITLAFPSVFKVLSIKIGGYSMQPEYLMCVIVSVTFMFALHIFMTKTKFGTSMRAAAMDPSAAESCGISVSFTTGVTWGVSSLVAAIAGILLGPIYGLYTTLGSTIGGKGFSGAVLGGYGNMYGAIIGGVSMGLIETFTAGYIGSDYKNIIAYVVLILFLFIKPTGILNERAIQDV